MATNRKTYRRGYGRNRCSGTSEGHGRFEVKEKKKRSFLFIWKKV